jgi:hypothetical protein
MGDVFVAEQYPDYFWHAKCQNVKLAMFSALPALAVP